MPTKRRVVSSKRVRVSARRPAVTRTKRKSALKKNIRAQYEHDFADDPVLQQRVQQYYQQQLQQQQAAHTQHIDVVTQQQPVPQQIHHQLPVQQVSHVPQQYIPQQPLSTFNQPQHYHHSNEHQQPPHTYQAEMQRGTTYQSPQHTPLKKQVNWKAIKHMATPAVALVLLGSMGWYGYGYVTQPTDSVATTIAAVGKIVELPDETPRIAKVSDPKTLPKNFIFSNTVKDDVVMMYEGASVVVIYRPSTGKVVAMAPLAATAEPQPTEQPEPAPVDKSSTASSTKR